ncbi:MAG: dNTP triphosphohydrolase [bacterium]|nr:dNTP triphosphohydrolase [bacterium]
MPGRSDRIRTSSSPDPRDPYQRDRDRVLYSPEFRRLTGVTQVASASEGDIFHNRLTHSLKVAQVGRRLAERLLTEFHNEVETWGGLDADVVEAAALAHDLGHPPFGHDGEEVLCELVDEGGLDGFEGNAQSFRIVTRLAAHADNDRDNQGGLWGNVGLNLTRATLNALLKYPWRRAPFGKGHGKWGAYRVDKHRFDWTRVGWGDGVVSLEAQLMDWADDVTYAVHDLEDFYRAGLIPIHRLVNPAEQDRLLEGAVKRRPALAKKAVGLDRALEAVLGPMTLLDRPYDGGRPQQMIMNAAVSSLITQFVTGNAVRVSSSSEKSVLIDEDIRLQVTLLKEVTHHYVIGHPRLVSVREGQREILKTLFGIFLEVLDGNRNHALLPQATVDREKSGDRPHRLVADLLAGMTERQAIQTFRRFTGIIPSAVAYFDV